MDHSPARDLAEAFYALEELEFFQPQKKFPLEKERVRRLIERAQHLLSADFHVFSRELVRVISSYCQDSSFHQGVVYRAFDGLDELLAIDYRENLQMTPMATGEERLYQGGGAGVQTSYSTIMKVLEHLRLAENSHLVDLGSGFGRVGLAAGLWREDLRFSGYEFVGHRVAAANFSAGRAGLGGRICFLQQDLSDASFQIPAADAYYLYDPFTASTYQHVFSRIAELSREKRITVIAKDGARRHFLSWRNQKEWEAPESIDEDSIHLFRSR